MNKVVIMELKHQVGQQIYNMKIKLKKLVKKYPNNYQLGEAVRHIYWMKANLKLELKKELNKKRDGI